MKLIRIIIAKSRVTLVLLALVLSFASPALADSDSLFNGPKPVNLQDRTKVLSKFFTPAPLYATGTTSDIDSSIEGPSIPKSQYRNLVKDEAAEDLKKFQYREILQKCEKHSTDLDAKGKCIESEMELLRKTKVPAKPKKGDLDAKDIMESIKKVSEVGLLRGSIKVTPPKGRCLTITKNKQTRDVRVCKSTNVEFELNEISIGGVLTWTVSTGADDTGTPIHWQTPHRIALVIGVDDGPKADSSPVYVNSCTAYNDDGGRRIHLTLFNGVVWAVRFPDKDILLPQPPPPPNLYVHVKNELIMTEKKANKPNEKATEEQKKTAESKTEATAEAAKIEPAKTEAPMLEEFPYSWTVTSLKTFWMSSAFFMPDGASTPGIPGKCRYRFIDPTQTLSGGILECQNAPGYSYALIPMACSAAFAK